MKKFLTISILIILILTGCTNQQKETITDGEKFKEEYESLNGEDTGRDNTYRTLNIDEENPFVYKKAKEIVEMMENKETFVVYFGFSSCPWCRSAIPSLINVANDLKIYEIFYVDVKEIRDTLKIDDAGNIVTDKEGTDSYYKLLEKLDNVLEEYTLTDKDGNTVSTGEKRIYAPNIISIIDGEAIKITDGISDKQTDGYMELTEEMKDESYDKIKCSIQCVADEQKVCSTGPKC